MSGLFAGGDEMMKSDQKIHFEIYYDLFQQLKLKANNEIKLFNIAADLLGAAHGSDEDTKASELLRPFLLLLNEYKHISHYSGINDVFMQNNLQHLTATRSSD